MKLNINENDLKICRLNAETKDILKEYFKNRLEKEQKTLLYCKTLEDFVKVQAIILVYSNFIDLLELKEQK